jgi:hypothetical protein
MEGVWVFQQTERGEHPLWTVGYYEPKGEWVPESDHESADKAAARVHYLNGGN